MKKLAGFQLRVSHQAKEISFLEKIPDSLPAWAERLSNKGFTAHPIQRREFRSKAALRELVKGSLRESEFARAILGAGGGERFRPLEMLLLVGKKQSLRFLATLHTHHIHLKEGTDLAGFSGNAFIHQDVTPINAGQALNP